MIRNTHTGWGSISRLFHWGLGFVIIGMLAYGWWMNHMAARPDRFSIAPFTPISATWSCC
jgi:cytochrome b561